MKTFNVVAFLVLQVLLVNGETPTKEELEHMRYLMKTIATAANDCGHSLREFDMSVFDAANVNSEFKEFCLCVMLKLRMVVDNTLMEDRILEFLQPILRHGDAGFLIHFCGERSDIGKHNFNEDTAFSIVRCVVLQINAAVARTLRERERGY